MLYPCFAINVGYILLTFSVPVVHATACPPCGSNAACHNTTGSHACTCNCGYHGDAKNCTATVPPLGVSNRTVLLDSQMTASSSLNASRYGPNEGRLHGPRAWCAVNDTIGEYLQIDLRFPRSLIRIATQGRRSVLNETSANYVGSFKLQSSIDGVTWHNQTHKNGSQKVFAANADSNSVVCHVLNESAGFIARHVRLYPQSWRGHMCLRLELYGESDECEQQLDECPANSTCINTRQSYTCKCHEGFHKDGNICRDKDECKLGIDSCQSTSACGEGILWDGSKCTSCPTGYRVNGANCEDIDECGEKISLCHTSETCLNTIGSYNCTCKDGYIAHSNSTCLDLDECSLGTADCHLNATCTNTDGSYDCNCKDGFVGDRTLGCEDVDECSVMKCQLNSTCVNTPGSYVCQCEKGFSVNGQVCIDVDECGSQQTHNCHLNADCDNTYGSYRCTCRQGYAGDGVECTALLEAVLKQHKTTIISSSVIVGAALVCFVAFVFYRRKQRVRKKMRPSVTIMGHIDQMDDDDMARWRDSVSLHSFHFAIPSVHSSSLSLNNIVAQNSQLVRPKRGVRATAPSRTQKPRTFNEVNL